MHRVVCNGSLGIINSHFQTTANCRHLTLWESEPQRAGMSVQEWGSVALWEQLCAVHGVGCTAQGTALTTRASLTTLS